MTLCRFVILMCCAAMSSCTAEDQVRAPHQDFQPISDRSRRIEIPGVTVLPPLSDGWYIFPLSAQEETPATAMIRLVHGPQDGFGTKPEDARLVGANVMVLDTGQAEPRTPAAFLEGFSREFIRDGKLRLGEMITPRQRLIAFEGALDDSLGATCVRYLRTTEITGQFRAYPALVAINSTRGLICAHPHWPQYSVNVTFVQMYAKGGNPPGRDADSDAFLKSVAFTPSKPVAVDTPRGTPVPR